MSAAIEPAIIAGASAVTGGLVVAGSNYLVMRAQGRASRRTDLRKVLEAFLCVVNAVDQQLRVEPQPGRAATWWNQQAARLPQLSYTVRRLTQSLLAPQLDALTERMHAATAAVVLVAPLDVMPTMENISQLMERAETRDQRWWQEWDRARADLVVACRRTLGEPVATSSEPAQPQAELASLTPGSAR
jgi:hypothetical protein